MEYKNQSENSLFRLNMPLQHFYLSVPNADGIFAGNRASEEFEEGISIYKFELFKDYQNKASFWIAKEAIEFALDDADRRVKPVCNSVNYLNKDTHHYIKTKKPGIAKLLPSGNWKIETKAEIEYLEIDEEKRQKELQKEAELKRQKELEEKEEQERLRELELEKREKEAELKRQREFEEKKEQERLRALELENSEREERLKALALENKKREDEAEAKKNTIYSYSLGNNRNIN